MITVVFSPKAQVTPGALCETFKPFHSSFSKPSFSDVPLSPIPIYFGINIYFSECEHCWRGIAAYLLYFLLSQLEFNTDRRARPSPSRSLCFLQNLAGRPCFDVCLPLTIQMTEPKEGPCFGNTPNGSSGLPAVAQTISLRRTEIYCSALLSVLSSDHIPIL